MQFDKFIEENKITIKNKSVDKNHHMKNSERDMDNWKVTLKMNGHQYTIYFSKGFGHNGKEPTIENVLSDLQSDMFLIQNGYEDYLSNLGAKDTTEERKDFAYTEKQQEKLKKFFGDKFKKFMDLEN